ncbi:unnamed protein product, partial [Dibothriocephalus latus]
MLSDIFSSPSSASPSVHMKLVDLSEAVAIQNKQSMRHRSIDSSVHSDFSVIDRTDTTTTPAPRQPSSSQR